jgi:hypothetical protein
MRHAAALLVCIFVCPTFCQVAKAAGGEESAGIKVVLRLAPDIQLSPAMGVVQVRLGPSGEGSTPFANEAGKLLIRFKDGKVFCDANGDGAIDDADGEGVAPPGQYRLMGMPPMLLTTVKIGGRDEEFPLSLFHARKGLVVFGSGVGLRGKIGDWSVTLFDSNVNGSFSDIGIDGIRVTEGKAPAPARGRSFTPGSGKLGSLIAVGGELFSIELKQGGASLKLTPYAGEKATLTLETKEPVVAAALVLAHAGGIFTCQATSNSATTLPAGKYRVQRSRLILRPPGDARSVKVLAEEFLGDPPSAPILMGTGNYQAKPITIRPGENALPVGTPLTLEFTAGAASDRKAFNVSDAVIIDGLGVRYSTQLQGMNAGSSVTVSVRADGKVKELSKLEYG